MKKYLQSLTYEKKLKEIGNLEKAVEELEKQLMNSEIEFKEVTRLSMLYIFQGENKKAEKLVTNYKKKLAS